MRLHTKTLFMATVALAVNSCAAHADKQVGQATVKKIDELMARYHQYGQFNGVVLVAQGNSILYQRALGKANLEWGVANTLDTKFEIASMTKPMTAILVMQLVEQGKVRLDGKISDYVPYYPRETGTKITIDQLLNHTSGIQQDIAFPDDPRDVPPIITKINADLLSNDDLVKLISARPLRFEPGTSYGYSSDAYAVLGAVVEHVTGKSYLQVLQERILKPTGMVDTVPALLTPLVPRRASGYKESFAGIENAPHIGATPAGGLYSTVHDLYLWERSLYGTSLVNQQSKDLLFGLRKVITAYGWKTAEEEWAGKRHAVLRTTGGLPGFVNLLLRVPDQERVIILLSNIRGSVYRLDDIAGGVNHILDGAPYEMPKQPIAEVLLRVLDRSGVPAMRTEFEKMRQRPAEYSLSESEMNALGYYLLNARAAVDAAVAVFQLNAEAFPKSANVHDSLGEAYLASGDKERAARSYRRSLELDPNNKNAQDVLRKLGK